MLRSSRSRDRVKPRVKKTKQNKNTLNAYLNMFDLKEKLFEF